MPFDEKDFITQKFLSSYKCVDQIFFFTQKKAKTFIYSNTIHTPIYRFDNNSKYLNHSAKNNIEFKIREKIDFEFVIISEIVHRWLRTYSSSESYFSIRNLVYKIYQYWYDFILENKVTLILFGNVPHTPHDFVIYSIATSLKLNVVFIQSYTNLFDNGITLVLSDAIDLSFPSKNMGQKHLQDDRVDINRLKESYTNESISYFNSPLTEISRIKVSSVKYLKRFFQNVYLSDQLKIDRVLRRAISIINFYRDKNLFFRYFRKVSTIQYSELIDKKYVFFPLHYQPESTTLPTGGIYRNLDFIIMELLKFLPKNFILVLKEHPYYFFDNKIDTGYNESFLNHRPREFYEYIRNQDNVCFISNDSDVSTLIKNSCGVVTVSGTPALESMMYRKKVLLFGNHHYKKLPNVIFFNDSSSTLEFMDCLCEVLEKEKFNNDLENYLIDLSLNSVYVDGNLKKFQLNKSNMNYQLYTSKLMSILKRNVT